MDAVCYYLPSPLDRPPVDGPQSRQEGQGRDTQARSEGAVLRPGLQDRRRQARRPLLPAHLLRHARRRTAGCSNPGPRQVKEFASKIYHILADPNNREDLPLAYAGDIVGIIGPKDSITGDTLCDQQHPIVLEQIQFAEAVVSMSIEPESSADKDKLTDALDRLKREDPTFTWRIDADTGQTLMNGMGILHLEVKKHRLERDFRLKVRVGKPLRQLPRDAAAGTSRSKANASSKRARRACSPS